MGTSKFCTHFICVFNMAICTALIFAVILGACRAQNYIDDGLDLHNDYRYTHHADDLQLDDDLNDKAMECAEYYASIGKIDHSCKARGKAGENLAWSYSSRGSPSQSFAMKQAIRWWYDEIDDYDFDSPDRSTTLTTGHFTQMVWKASKKVGLASYQDIASKKTFTVALYRPPGNIVLGGSKDRWKFYKANVKKP